MAEPVFDLDALTVSYREVMALRDVTLRIAPGDCVGLIGPSGAGKTTLLRALVGAARPAGGRIRANGHDLSTLDARSLRLQRARTGFVHQDHRLV